MNRSAAGSWHSASGGSSAPAAYRCWAASAHWKVHWKRPVPCSLPRVLCRNFWWWWTRSGSPCRSSWPTGCCWCAAKKRCWPPAQSSWHSRACTAIFRGRAGAALCRRLCFAARTPRMQPGSWPDMRKNWTSCGSAWSWPSAPAKSRAASWSACAATFR